MARMAMYEVLSVISNAGQTNELPPIFTWFARKMYVVKEVRLSFAHSGVSDPQHSWSRRHSHISSLHLIN